MTYSATFTRIYSYMCTSTRFFTRIYGASTRIYWHLCVFFRADLGCLWRDPDDIRSIFARKRVNFGTVARRPRRSIRACDCPDSTSRSRVSCRVGSKNRHPDCRRGKRTTCLRTASRMPAGSVCWRPAGALWVYGICTVSVRFLYGFCTVLHGKVRIYAPGKQENGGPSVSNRSLNHDVASLRVWQARARRIQVLWRETGAKPAKVKSGTLNSGGGYKSGRGGHAGDVCGEWAFVGALAFRVAD